MVDVDQLQYVTNLPMGESSRRDSLMPHTVQSAIELFKQSDEMLRLSKSTQARHRTVLRQLQDEAGYNLPIARLNRGHIDGVLADRRAAGVLESSLNAYKSTLRLFCSFALDSGLVKKNPAAHLRNVKTITPKSKRKPITADKFREMAKLAGARHPRDAATLYLLLFTGCRAAEIVNLRWRDIDWEDSTLTVYRSKVRDYLTCPMPDELVKELRAWESIYIERSGPLQPAWYVVPALKHKGFDKDRLPFRMSSDWPLNPTRPQQNVRGVVKKLLRAAGETDLHGRAAHVMRRTAANLLLEQTNDIRIVQSFLGHESVRMTEKYLDQDVQSAKAQQAIRMWNV